MPSDVVNCQVAQAQPTFARVSAIRQHKKRERELADELVRRRVEDIAASCSAAPAASGPSRLEALRRRVRARAEFAMMARPGE